MKSKKTIFIAVALIMTTLISTQVFALQTKDKKVKLNYNVVTQQEKASVELIEKKLNDAWDDIKYSFEIDDTKYTLLNFFGDIPDFSEGKYPGYTDKKLISEVTQVIANLYNNPPKGSTIPVILINSNMDEVIVCYKKADGTNVMKQATKKDNKWQMEESEKLGKPVLKIK